MSKVMILSAPHCRPIFAAAMTPAEGPETAVLIGHSMVSLMEMIEPFDCVT